MVGCGTSGIKWQEVLMAQMKVLIKESPLALSLVCIWQEKIQEVKWKEGSQSRGDYSLSLNIWVSHQAFRDEWMLFSKSPRLSIPLHIVGNRFELTRRELQFQQETLEATHPWWPICKQLMPFTGYSG